MTHPNQDRWNRQIEFARRLLDQLQDAGPELFKRDRESAQADGYPSSSMGGDGRGGSESSSTENAALAEHRRDVIHDDALACRHNMNDAVDALLRALRSTQHAEQKGTLSAEDVSPAGTCLACHRKVEGTANDRLRSGYCAACYRAWLRDGKPDRLRFERARRQEAA